MRNATETLPVAYVVDWKGQIRFIQYAPNIVNRFVRCTEKKARGPDGKPKLKWEVNLTDQARERGCLFLEEAYAAENFGDGWDVWTAYHKADKQGRLKKHAVSWKEKSDEFTSYQNEPFDEKFLPKLVIDRRTRFASGGVMLEEFRFPANVKRPPRPAHFVDPLEDIKISGVSDD